MSVIFKAEGYINFGTSKLTPKKQQAGIPGTDIPMQVIKFGSASAKPSQAKNVSNSE